MNTDTPPPQAPCTNHVTHLDVNTAKPALTVRWCEYQQTEVAFVADEQSLTILVAGMPIATVAAVARTAPIGVFACGDCDGCLHDGDCTRPLP